MAFRVSLVAAALVLSIGAVRSQELGIISFPTSGSAPAQAHFINGVRLLHGLEYDKARKAFLDAEKAEPGFAMAYWGEALTLNHPISPESSPDLAKAALGRLAPTAAGRLAKAPTAKEKDWLGAVEKLIGAGDRHARDVAYADAMKRLADKYPDDVEVKVFYASALLGTGDSAGKAKAASVLDSVLASAPAHPGALLYALRANDDASHLVAATRLADAYAAIEGASAAGLHFASRPYLGAGRWDEATAVNEKSVKLNPSNMDARVGLVYSYTQQGRIEAARDMVSQIEAAARESGSRESRADLAMARAAFLVESRKWIEAKAPVDPTGLSRDAIAADLFAIGFAGARSGNRAQANGAMQRLAALMQDAPENLAPVRTAPTGARPGVAPIAPGPKAVPQPGISPIKPDPPPTSAPVATAGGAGDSRVPQVMAQQLEAAILFAEGRRDEGVVLARQAAVVESLLPFEFGPPNPVKPVNEQVGEMLMDLRRPKEAMEAFQMSLKRTPKRALSLLGLARAATAARDPAIALAAYGELKDVWKSADATLPELKEVVSALVAKPSSR